jgi:hypothetical protein
MKSECLRSQTVTIKNRSCPTVNQPQQKCTKYCFQISVLQIRFVSLCKITRILLKVTTPLFMKFFHNLNLKNYHSKYTVRVCSLSCSKIIAYFTMAHILFLHPVYCGPGSSVGIATDYGLDGPGSNPGADEIFRPSRPALGPT